MPQAVTPTVVQRSGRWPWAIAFGILFLLGGPAAWAQGRAGQGTLNEGGSHVPLPPAGNEPTDAEELLSRRLGLAMQRKDPLTKQLAGSLLKQQAKTLQGLSGDDLQRLMKYRAVLDDPNRIDLNDPELRNLVERIVKENPTLLDERTDATREQVAAFKQLFQPRREDMKPAASQPGSGSPDGQSSGSPSRESQSGSGESQGQPASPQRQFSQEQGTTTAPPGGQSGAPEWQSRLTRQFIQMADKIQGNNPELRDSPTLRRLIRDLHRDQQGGGAASGPGLGSKLEDLASRFEGVARNFEGKVRIPWKADSLTAAKKAMPTLPGMTIPSGILTRPRPEVGSGPTGVPEMRGPSLIWVLLWLALAGLVGFLVWRFRWPGAETAVPGSRAAWQLGPWPVNPAAVATRDELVQAFEYLSLLRLGRAARSWNHHVLAVGLGSQGMGELAERARAARELAALYERARYAPLDDHLPDGALDAARRDLCYLAGVARA